MDRSPASEKSHVFPDSFLDDLRNRVPLSALIGRKVAWDKGKTQSAKGTFWACCPFHGEKTASFKVDDARGRYHCFGCEASGDHFTWVMHDRHMTFPEAVKAVAEEAGVALPEMTPQQRQKESLRRSLFDINEAAAKWFHEQLLDPKTGQAAQAYLNRRDVPPQQWLDFQLGVAPFGRSLLVEHLKGLNFAEDAIVAAGLAKEGVGSNPATDFFRNRLMFPIRDSRGRVCGFGGRALGSGDKVKYLNTPETPIFDKRRLLYNLGHVMDLDGDQQGKLVVVEGYMDVLACDRAGMPFAVAPMGTALGTEQLKMAWRVADEPAIMLDGDAAGLKATSRVMREALTLLEPGKSLGFAILPEKQDPADMVEKGEGEALAELFAAPVPLVEMLWRDLTTTVRTGTPEQRAKFEAEVVAAVALIGHEAVRKQYEAEIAARLKTFWKDRGVKPTATRFEKKSSKSAAPPGASESAAGDQGGRGGRGSQADSLIGMAEATGLHLYKDPDGELFADFHLDDHWETWPIDSQNFRFWLIGLYLGKLNLSPGRNAIEDAVTVFMAKAANGRECHKVHRRVGRAGNKIFVDCCDDKHSAHMIAAEGWSKVDRPECKFTRGPAMRPLMEPEGGGMIEELGNFTNCQSERDFILFVGFLVNLFRPSGPHPICIVVGEPGTAKSTMSRIAQQLCDPNGSPLRPLVDSERDFIVGAYNGHLNVYDNVSTIGASMSDALARLATGGGVSYRALYSDKEESYMDICRPVIINGINEMIRQPDLASRAQRVALRVIPETERLTESDFWAAFEAAGPRILGALFDAVACALKNYDTVKLERLPRMADYVRWVTAAEPALGWEPGTFLRAFEESAVELNDTIAEEDILVTTLVDFFASRSGQSIHCTVGNLLSNLNAFADDRTRNSHRWPRNPTALGNRLRNLATTLRGQGFKIDFHRSGKRMVQIEPPLTEGGQ